MFVLYKKQDDPYLVVFHELVNKGWTSDLDLV